MEIRVEADEMSLYRIVAIDPRSRKVLMLRGADGPVLPCVSIRSWSRRVVEIRQAIEASWNVVVFVLDFIGTDCVVAEILNKPDASPLEEISISGLSGESLTEMDRATLQGFVSDQGIRPLSRIGWIRDAMAWVESAVEERLDRTKTPEQWSAGGGFALVRFVTQQGNAYWLKAAAPPHAHESSVTGLLSRLGSNYLPKQIASNPAWNAWLMSSEGHPFSKTLGTRATIAEPLRCAVKSMAMLQRSTLGHHEALLLAGAFDQSLETLQGSADTIFDFLEEATSLQTSVSVRRVDKKRLQEIRQAFHRSSEKLSSMALPKTILHGDMNPGNILTSPGLCKFIDWCEAYVGPSIITFEHLLLLNKIEDRAAHDIVDTELKRDYLSVWKEVHSLETLEKAFAFTPLLAMISTLHRRGVRDPLSSLPSNHAFAIGRNMARRMDEAVATPSFLHGLQHPH